MNYFGTNGCPLLQCSAYGKVVLTTLRILSLFAALGDNRLALRANQTKSDSRRWAGEFANDVIGLFPCESRKPEILRCCCIDYITDWVSYISFDLLVVVRCRLHKNAMHFLSSWPQQSARVDWISTPSIQGTLGSPRIVPTKSRGLF